MTFDLIQALDRDSMKMIIAVVQRAFELRPNKAVMKRALGLVLNSAARTEGLEAIVNADRESFVDVGAFMTQLAAAELAVCLIESPERSAVGTGFLVTEDLVLTCHHVWDQCMRRGEADVIRFAFDYRVLADGMETAVTRVGIGHCVPIRESATADLDFALLQLSDRIGGARVANRQDAPKRGWLKPVAHAFSGNESALVLQHPQGQPMKLAFGRVGPLLGNRIPYGINSLAGSSGAPVFLNSMDLVALHRQSLNGSENAGVPFAQILPQIQAQIGSRG
jgi:hypothetical protein